MELCLSSSVPALSLNLTTLSDSSIHNKMIEQFQYHYLQYHFKYSVAMRIVNRLTISGVPN